MCNKNDKSLSSTNQAGTPHLAFCLITNLIAENDLSQHSKPKDSNLWQAKIGLFKHYVTIALYRRNRFPHLEMQHWVLPFIPIPLIYSNATNPAATTAKAPGTFNITSPEDLIVVALVDAAEEEADPVAEDVALEVADPDAAAVEGLEDTAAEPEEEGVDAPNVPPVPMATVGVIIVALLAALM